jgi:hypothetical protein
MTEVLSRKEIQKIMDERGITHISADTVRCRLVRGRSLEDALMSPVLSAKEAGRVGGKASSWQKGYK